MKRKVIFLDFDGVLHPGDALSVTIRASRLKFSGELLFCWAHILDEIASQHPCQIVIHSSWRLHMDLRDLSARLPKGVAACVVGSTKGDGRYQSIQDYKREHGVSSCRILDDDAAAFPQACADLILCNPDYGLHERKVQQQLLSYLSSTGAE